MTGAGMWLVVKKSVLGVRLARQELHPPAAWRRSMDARRRPAEIALLSCPLLPLPFHSPLPSPFPSTPPLPSPASPGTWAAWTSTGSGSAGCRPRASSRPAASSPCRPPSRHAQHSLGAESGNNGPMLQAQLFQEFAADENGAGDTAKLAEPKSELLSGELLFHSQAQVSDIPLTFGTLNKASGVAGGSGAGGGGGGGSEVGPGAQRQPPPDCHPVRPHQDPHRAQG